MKHVAWDFDGTIIDTLGVWVRVLASYCADEGLPVPPEHEAVRSFGDTAWAGFSVWPFPLRDQDAHRFRAYARFYELQQADPDSLPAVTGILDVIDSVARCGLIQSVVTSRPRAMLLHMLDHLRIRDVFRLLNTGECAVERGQREKPAPDKLLFVMAELGVGPADTVMIGDTYMDVGMGKSAGCRTFAVTWGMGSEESLVSAGADAIVQSSGDLERLLLEFFNEDSRQPGRKKFSISAQSTGNPT